MPCEVCNDSGTYPVVNRKGQTLYEIRCPECTGLGMEIIKPQQTHEQRGEYVPDGTAG